MKVVQIVKTDDDYRNTFSLEINGNIAFSIKEGEPEDASIHRDLNDVFKLKDIIRKAYDSGRNGEPYVFMEHEIKE